MRERERERERERQRERDRERERECVCRVFLCSAMRAGTEQHAKRVLRTYIACVSHIYSVFVRAG